MEIKFFDKKVRSMNPIQMELLPLSQAVTKNYNIQNEHNFKGSEEAREILENRRREKETKKIL